MIMMMTNDVDEAELLLDYAEAISERYCETTVVPDAQGGGGERARTSPFFSLFLSFFFALEYCRFLVLWRKKLKTDRRSGKT